MRTFNVTETAEWIIQMADKIQREELKNKNVKSFYQNKVAVINTIDDVIDANNNNNNIIKNDEYDSSEKQNYTNVVANKRIKKNNVTPENIGEIMLSQIPGVSTNVAIAIMKKFGTMQKLIDTLKNNDTSVSSPLKEIIISTNLGKNRYLNKTHIANISKFLL